MKLLGQGMEWVSSRGNHKLPRKHERAILTAVRELTPKKDSAILKVEVSGKVITGDSQFIPLTTDTRTDITDKIKSKKPQSIERVGLIRELDEDKQSFELRNMKIQAPNKRIKFVFDATQHDNVYRLLGKHTYVKVSGEREGGHYKLVDLNEEPT